MYFILNKHSCPEKKQLEPLSIIHLFEIKCQNYLYNDFTSVDFNFLHLKPLKLNVFPFRLDNDT